MTDAPNASASPAASDPEDASVTFALALRSLDGVGRVTARRLFTRFDSYDDLRGHSREQVLLRIKSVSNGSAIVEQLFDEDAMAGALDQAEQQRATLRERGVQLLGPRSAAWPEGLGALPEAEQPLLLWAYGDAGVLQRPVVAFLARPPLAEAPFERAQALLGHLLMRGAVPIVAAQSGFDVALVKRAAGQDAAAALVAGCGLAKVSRKLRPVASQAARAGGLLLSPFPMTHGPFDHDDRPRARLQAALAGAAVFTPPAGGTPEARALAWSAEAGRPTFVLPEDDGDAPLAGLSEKARSRVHLVRGPDDFDAVFEAVAGA